MANARWAIITTDFLDEPAMVRLDDKDPSLYYWNGGPSHCRAKYKILREIEANDHTKEGNQAIDDLQLSLLNDYFKPQPATEPSQSEGWLAPDGKFFPCEEWNHLGAAKPLAALYYRSLRGESELVKNGWLRVYMSGMVSNETDYRCTQAQMDTMSWLLGAPSPKPGWSIELQGSIELYEVS